jgi:hypothetical protein
VSIEALKQELAALDADQQRLMTAFLVSLQDSRDATYRKKMAAKIDQPPSSFATLDELNERLKLPGDDQ